MTTGSRNTQLLGAAVLAGFAVLVWLAFGATDPDVRINATTGEEFGQFDAVRLMYVHVPSAIIAYLAFFVTAVGSVMVLWRRSVWWDLVAGASAEIGAVIERNGFGDGGRIRSALERPSATSIVAPVVGVA